MKSSFTVLHIISSLKIGGAEILLVDLINQLKAQGIDNHVIYFHDGPVAQRLRALKIPLYNVKGIISLYDPYFFYSLARIIKKINPDCIHTSLWAANFAGRIVAKLFGYPILSAVHTDVRYEGAVRNGLDHFSFFLSNRIIAVSDLAADSLIKKKWVTAQKIMVIKNGVDSYSVQQKAKQASIIRSDLNLAASDFVIGSVGRFISNKNYSMLIEAFKNIKQKISSAKLVLVGMGPEEQTLRAIVQELALTESVRFVVGKLAYGYYPLFDCFVLSSHQEGLSIALLEALCFKLPVITSSANGQHDVIKHGFNGILINAADRLALENAILSLAVDKELCNTLGLAGYQTLVQNHDSYQMAQSYKRMYESIANK